MYKRQAGFTDWEGLLESVNGDRKKRLPINHRSKIKADATALDIARAVRKEQEAEKLEKPMDTPDYDSTYIKPT